MIPCPSCHSLCTIPIVYGKPDHQLERAASRGLIELGGCVIDFPDPNRRCLDCRNAWMDRPKSPESTFISTAVVMVQKLKDALSSQVSNYGVTCIAYGRMSERRDPDQSSSYLEMMRAYRSIDDEWARFFVMAQYYCNRYSGIDQKGPYGHFYWPDGDA